MGVRTQESPVETLLQGNEAGCLVLAGHSSNFLLLGRGNCHYASGALSGDPLQLGLGWESGGKVF